MSGRVRMKAIVAARPIATNGVDQRLSSRDSRLGIWRLVPSE